MTLRFAPNLSLLWAELPLPERFARAAAAGFGAVELWWPGDEDAALLPGLTDRSGLRLALLNFDAGDMGAGDRGLAADPDRTAQLRGQRAAGAAHRRGLRLPPAEPAGRAARPALRAGPAAPAGARQRGLGRRPGRGGGRQVMIEAVNSMENGPYLLTTTAAAAEFVGQLGRRTSGCSTTRTTCSGWKATSPSRWTLLGTDQPHPDRRCAGPG